MANITHSTKRERTFTFDYELSDITIENLKLHKRRVGMLTVEGMGYHWPNPDTEFAVDIDYIKWNGTDIKPVLEVLDCWAVAQIQEAATSWVAKNLFATKPYETREEETSPNITAEADVALQLLRVKSIVEERVGNGMQYFDAAVRVQLTDFISLNIWGVRVSPDGALYVMDADQAWEELKGTSDAEQKIISAVHARLQQMQNQKQVA